MSSSAPTTASRLTVAEPSRGRLLAIDVARTVALVGMVIAHLGDRPYDIDYSDPGWIVAGRPSALFAVLAGVSIALVSGNTNPLGGRPLRRARVGMAVRAVFIYLIGLYLMAQPSGLAVILPAYGAMFLLATPFMGLPAKALMKWATGWLLLGPFLAAPIRELFSSDEGLIRSLPDHGGWAGQTEELLVSGYYPVVVWFGYVLLGMAIGRMNLRSPQVHLTLMTVGAALAVFTFALGRIVTSQGAVRQALVESWTRRPGVDDWPELERLASHGLYGTTPGGTFWWQFTAYPHSSTLFDMLHTSGTAMLTIGLCLGAVRLLAGDAWRIFWRGLGAMGVVSLSAYTLHVMLRAHWSVEPPLGPTVMGIHLAVLFALGWIVVMLAVRGPLEALVARTSRSVADAVVPPDGTTSTESAGQSGAEAHPNPPGSDTRHSGENHERPQPHPRDGPRQ